MYSRLLEECPLQEYFSHETIVDRFGHVASIYGGSVALTSHNGEAFTYQELDELSDRVASALVSTLGPRAGGDGWHLLEEVTPYCLPGCAAQQPVAADSPLP